MSTLAFSKKTNTLLSQATKVCDRRGTQLTELRKKVLGLVLESKKPTGAYDLLDQLRALHKGAAPPTVYRALDFLLEQGLIHKVERLSAFIGCVHRHEADHDHHHVAQFLICTRCGQVTELEDARIDKVLIDAANESGFRLISSTVEAEGLCAACAVDAGGRTLSMTRSPMMDAVRTAVTDVPRRPLL